MITMNLKGRLEKKLLLTFLTVILLFTITACKGEAEDTLTNQENIEENDQSENDNNSEEQSEKNKNVTEFPFTTTIEDHEITIEKKSEKIAALSLNVAETVMDLAGPESIVAVTTSMEQENLSHFADEAELIENKVAGASSLDPEVVISYDPDLILLTLTHGAEEDADDILTKADIPLASFSRWVTLEDLMNNYQDIGQLIGEKEKATEIIEDMQAKIEEAENKIDDNQEKPTVLMLSQVGSTTGPYILGPSSIAYDLIQHAGGKSGSDILSLDKTSPASIEHIIEMDPDYVILVEWSATSDEFTELIDSDGFQALSAVENGNVKQMKAKDISQANRFIVDQLDDLAEWLNEDLD